MENNQNPFNNNAPQGNPVPPQQNGNSGMPPVQQFGAPQPQAQQFNGGFAAPPAPQHKQKKPFYKRWWFWVIVVILVLGIAGSKGGSDDKGAADSSTTTAAAKAKEEEKETTTEKATTTTTETTTETTTKGESKKEYKESCEKIPYKSLARDPDKYKGKRVKFTGEVVQVIESTWGTSVTYRISVSKEDWGYSSDEIVYVTYTPGENESRILEDDIVTFYGESAGLTSYQSTLGGKITIPQVDAKYIVLQE